MSFTKFKTCLIILTVLFTTNNVQSNNNLNFIDKDLPTATKFSFIAKNLNNNQILISHLADNEMMPASVQKVFTSLFAKTTLGDDFKFQTTLLTNGNIKDNTLDGNLIVKFTGDPVLTSQDIKDLLLYLVNNNIHRIKGNLIIDSSIFKGDSNANRKIEEDYINCYTAPGSAININKNCLTILFNTNKPISSSASYEHNPLTNAVNIDSHLTIGANKQITIKKIAKNKAKQKNNKTVITTKKIAHTPKCGMSARIIDNTNSYSFLGCLRQRNTPWYYNVAIHNPEYFAGRLVKNYLDELNIHLDGKVFIQPSPKNSTVLVTHYSPTLDSLIKEMMKKSDNQIADVLFRASAYSMNKKPVSFDDAGQAMLKKFKTLNIDINPKNIFKDGSGLSRENKIYADSLLNVLDYIAKNNNTLSLIDAFPIAGVDGTLKHRASFVQHETLCNNIIAKTGTMKDIINLAGYLRNKKNELIAFVQLVNNYPKRIIGRQKINNIEQELYLKLYSD